MLERGQDVAVVGHDRTTGAGALEHLHCDDASIGRNTTTGRTQHAGLARRDAGHVRAVPAAQRVIRARGGAARCGRRRCAAWAVRHTGAHRRREAGFRDDLGAEERVRGIDARIDDCHHAPRATGSGVPGLGGAGDARRVQQHGVSRLVDRHGGDFRVGEQPRQSVGVDLQRHEGVPAQTLDLAAARPCQPLQQPVLPPGHSPFGVTARQAHRASRAFFDGLKADDQSDLAVGPQRCGQVLAHRLRRRVQLRRRRRKAGCCAHQRK